MNGIYMSTEEFEAIKNRASAFQNEDALKLVEHIETLAQGVTAVKRAAQKEQQLRQRYYAALLKSQGVLRVNLRKLKKAELESVAELVRDEIVGALGSA